MTSEETTTEAATTKTKEPKRGVGAVATEAIKAGKTNAEALDAVKAEFPEAKTSLASINWYRNKLRADGFDVPTARQLQKKAKAEQAPAEDGDDGEGEEDPLA